MSEGIMETGNNRKPVLSTVFETSVPFLIRAVTPLHPGSGARVSGLVDLPVQRESHTDYPVIYASSLKGALKAWAGGVEKLDKDVIEKIFGPEPGQGDRGMGKAVFMDAKLLLLPVRSLKGVYGWVTSPFLLERFHRDMELIKELTGREVYQGESDLEVGDNQAKGSEGNVLKFQLKDRDVVVLEDLLLDFESEELTFLKLIDESMERGVMDRILVVHDETFNRLLKRSLEVTPHIMIDQNTGTVGNLWFQENLPAETVMYSIAFTREYLREELRKVLKGVVHVGGDITTGLGFAKIYYL